MIEYWYRFKHRHLPFALAYLGKYLVKMLAATCRFKVIGKEHLITQGENRECILSLWHNRLPFVAPILEKVAPQFEYAAFISDSRDGELIATIAESYKQVKTIRVPKRNRSYSLKIMIDELKKKQAIVVITPDGPRGPRYQVKPGIVHAAQETGTPIISLSWEASRYWSLNTWDQMMIPKPFSTVTVRFSQPITVQKGDLELASADLNRLLL